ALGRGRRLGLLLGGCALFALLMSLGRYTPVHNLVRAVVRPLSYMRYPEKYLVALVALVGLMAGQGAGRILDEPARPWRRTAVVLLVLALLAALAPAVFPAVWAPFVRWGAVKGALALLLVLGVQGLSGRPRRARWPSCWRRAWPPIWPWPPGLTSTSRRARWPPACPGPPPPSWPITAIRSHPRASTARTA